VILLMGVDENDDSILDSSEVSATVPVCNGLNGANGTNGTNGHNALTNLVSQADGGGSSCPTGGITVLSGTDLNNDGILEISEVSQAKDVCNGLAGAQGPAGINGTDAPSPPFSIVELVNPCGDAPYIYDELFLRLGNGRLVASFSDNSSGKNTRFSELVPGSYMTTDGDGCIFTVTSDFQIVNENHHY
jgi:hypothetical protein